MLGMRGWIRCGPLAAMMILVIAAAPARADAANPQTHIADPLPLLELIAPGGTGRLYTLLEAEATNAVGAGYALQPVRTGYMSQGPFADSQPVYRLRDTSRRSWLLTASDSERTQLAASGSFRDEGIVGYTA